MMAQKSDEVRGHLGDVDREVVALGHAGLALVDHDAQLGHRLSQAERERAEREKTEGKQNEV